MAAVGVRRDVRLEGAADSIRCVLASGLRALFFHFSLFLFSCFGEREE